LIIYAIIGIIILAAGLVSIVLSVRITASSLSDVKEIPFECGFESIGSARMRFSLKFYMVAIVFLIFDVEVVVILPVPISCRLLGVKD